MLSPSSANPSVFGQSVMFTATVTASSGTPTGTVVFEDGSTPLGSGTLDNNGVATFSTTTLSVATHSITAVYSSDSNFASSTTASPLMQSVVSPTPPVAPPVAPPVLPPVIQAVRVSLITQGKGKKAKLAAQVTFSDGTTRVILSPFQQPSCTHIAANLADSNGGKRASRPTKGKRRSVPSCRCEKQSRAVNRNSCG